MRLKYFGLIRAWLHLTCRIVEFPRQRFPFTGRAENESLYILPAADRVPCFNEPLRAVLNCDTSRVGESARIWGQQRARARNVHAVPRWIDISPRGDQLTVGAVSEWQLEVPLGEAARSAPG